MSNLVRPEVLARFRENTDPLVLSAMWKVGKVNRPPMTTQERDALNLWLDARIWLVIDAMLQEDLMVGRRGRRRNYPGG